MSWISIYQSNFQSLPFLWFVDNPFRAVFNYRIFNVAWKQRDPIKMNSSLCLDFISVFHRRDDQYTHRQHCLRKMLCLHWLRFVSTVLVFKHAHTTNNTQYGIIRCVSVWLTFTFLWKNTRIAYETRFENFTNKRCQGFLKVISAICRKEKKICISSTLNITTVWIKL